MIDHLGYSYENFDEARRFFAESLAPLGFAIVTEFETGHGPICGFGVDGKPEFWIHPGARLTPPLHLCFRAERRALVDAFHAAAIAAGGTDNGAPGLRPHYHENYYAAFVLDPDGHNIEAVTHRPE